MSKLVISYNQQRVRGRLVAIATYIIHPPIIDNVVHGIWVIMHQHFIF